MEETNGGGRATGRGQGEKGGREGFVADSTREVMEELVDGLEVVAAGEEANEES